MIDARNKNYVIKFVRNAINIIVYNVKSLKFFKILNVSLAILLNKLMKRIFLNNNYHKWKKNAFFVFLKHAKHNLQIQYFIVTQYAMSLYVKNV